MVCTRWTLVVGIAGALAGCASGSGPNTSAIASLGDESGSDETTDGGGSATSMGPSEDSTAGPMTSVGSMSTSDTTDGTGDDDPDDTGTDDGVARCEDDPAACNAWLLAPGGESWVPLALDADSPLAPTEPVRGAFDIESENLGFVVTDTRVHGIDLISRQWTREDNRMVVLPDVGDEEILVTYTVPSHWLTETGRPGPTEGISLLSATTAFFYNYDIATEQFVFDGSMPLPASAWGSPSAPSAAQVRASWIDVLNGDGWMSGTVMEACGTSQRVGPYQAMVATDAMHVLDVGYCFEYFDPTPLDAFMPFSLPNAPAGADIGGALYSETAGVWVFRGL